MILGQDVENAFRQLFGAHRELGLSEQRVASLRIELEQAERDVESNQAVVRDLNTKINRMARDASGAPSSSVAEDKAPRSEFIPLRR